MKKDNISIELTKAIKLRDRLKNCSNSNEFTEDINFLNKKIELVSKQIDLNNIRKHIILDFLNYDPSMLDYMEFWNERLKEATEYGIYLNKDQALDLRCVLKHIIKSIETEINHE